MEREKAEFNDALESLRQLASWFLAANQGAMQLNAFEWYHSLLCAYRDLVPYMNDKEEEKYFSMSQDLQPLVSKAQAATEKTGRATIDLETYKKLNLFHVGLRKIQKKYGLLMKFQEDASRALF